MNPDAIRHRDLAARSALPLLMLAILLGTPMYG